ncbi:unnamed protein product [Ambrosiozyma monospora]|uniref:Unnamed protein product n=1 Tax=Ambrosiozyma monospora TaxID=43982 RepID=A0ACB5SR55_AMBMO|nr:unnamed protein product [Ambrosiozyma monospora]
MIFGHPVTCIWERILGTQVGLGYSYITEFQKRGNPHIHAVLVLDLDVDEETGAMSPADMERLVTTMKPERTDVLYTAVTSMMSHNCKDTYCGGVSGKCKGVFRNQSEANLLSIIMVELK